MNWFIFLARLVVITFLQRGYATKLTYEWYANLTAGSLLPAEHLSHAHIIAKLHVYVTNNVKLFQIHNLDVNTVNNVLELPFQATYDDVNISFVGHETDQIWSLNMKKSVASMFQIKSAAYREGAFETKEDNIYGTCQVEYITNKIGTGLRIVKLIDEASCTSRPDRRRSNTPDFTCPSAFKEGVVNHHERSYLMLPSHKPHISEISSFGTIHFQPFQALAEAHYIQVSQYLKLMQIDNETVPAGLNILLTQPQPITYTTETVQVSTFGQHFPENKTLLKTEIYHFLEKLTDSLDWRLGASNLDNQTSFHILELMWWLEVEDWQELYEMIFVGTSYSQETIQHFFLDLLPQVGSKASVAYIKTLVASKPKRIKDFSACLLLVTFPLHMKNVSETFLVESEDFLQLKDLDDEVQNAAILGFAVLIQRACKVYCSKELLDRYTKYYLDKFMETPNYEDQMVYLQALSNMKLSRILDFLSPIATNPAYDRHIRYLTIWCMVPTIETHPTKATEILWPIFINSSESLEIRVSSLYILMTTQPSASRLLTLFWHMRNEPNYHFYNFFYTTIHSFANTKYPCYQKIRQVASQLSRYLLPRAYRWATGNYIIDYEDTLRGYGGLIQFFIVASEKTGLPSTIVVSTEQHSHGLSSKFSIHLKLEGVVNTVWKTLFDVTNVTSFFSSINIEKLLKVTNSSIKSPETVHAELMVKIDGNTVYCKYFNESSFTHILSSIERASALYYEFSVNFQRVRFPLAYEMKKPNDLGTPVNLQIRTSSMLSLRGSIKQIENGARRDAELDFRYSMNTVTSLKTLNTLTKHWYGTDRTRSLHVRIPISTHLFEKQKRSFFEVTADRHKDFVDESMQGVVWHSTIKLFPTQNKSAQSTPVTDGYGKHWSLESRDLGARFDANVFDCYGEGNLLGSLNIIKEAFQLSNNNYKMVIGGIPVLGLYSLANYFTFIPPGDSCGIILSMRPLQVQLALAFEGNTVHITLRTEREKLQIWDLIIKNRENENEGLVQVDFKLDHPKHVIPANIERGSLRLIQLEGYVKTPSFRQGILNAPSPIEGQARFSWEQMNQSTTIELSLKSENSATNWPVDCVNDSALCLQAISNLATKQTVTLNSANLPIWATTALLSMFPDNVKADKRSTTVQFSLPAKLPWTTQGECVVSHNKVLSFDNGTIQNYPQQTDCYSIAVLDCYSPSQFVVGVRRASPMRNALDVKVITAFTTLTVFALEGNSTQSMLINDTRIPIQNYYQFYPPNTNASSYLFQYKYWEKSKMVELAIRQGELILQYYGESVVAIASFKLRGRMCGLCGDFNGEISNDDINSTACVSDLHTLD